MSRFKILLNGCFDLLHPGHRYLINLALHYSFEGNVLILLNSDESVRELKGPGRPINSVTDRGIEIQKVVDKWCVKHKEYPKVRIVIFNTENELRDKINEYKPTMIIKGDDREASEIVGSDRWPVLIVPRISKNGIVLSTSDRISRGILDRDYMED